MGVGAFARAASGGGDGGDLEAAGEVVGETAECCQTPSVVVGRDDIEGELALEFGDRLLLGSPAARGPQSHGPPVPHGRGDSWSTDPWRAIQDAAWMTLPRELWEE